MIEIRYISTLDKNLSEFVIHGDRLSDLGDTVFDEYIFNVEEI